MATPYATTHLASTSSTQDEARARFDGSAVLVTAREQTAGRGRKGRSWVTAPRSVAASLAVAPTWPASAWPRMTLVAGMAGRDALDAMVTLDWPNDLVIGDDKVGGLIAEAADGVVVFGFGVNLWWPDAPDGWTSIAESDPGAEVAIEVATAFADGLLLRLGAGPNAWGRQEYIALCSTMGQRVSWEGGVGVAIDVDDEGALIVETDSGVVALHSAEVGRIARSTVRR